MSAVVYNWNVSLFSFSREVRDLLFVRARLRFESFTCCSDLKMFFKIKFVFVYTKYIYLNKLGKHSKQDL